MKSRSGLMAAAAALGGLAGALVATRLADEYQRDHRILLAQLAARSDLIETARGPLEYAEAGGDGPALLVSHGGGGGFDQALACVELLGDPPLRVIAPSRFGYLRTPLPARPSPEAQADAYAALLDALGVDRAAVLAFSAGGMSAVAFALRHPGRCWGLVLVSAITRPRRLTGPGEVEAGEMLFGSDFAFWTVSTYLQPLILASTGFTAADRDYLATDPVARRSLDRMLCFNPVGLRRAGMFNDMAQAARLPRYAFDQITAPTLLIHGARDPLAPFHFAADAATTIPGAQLLILEDAGHLAWFTHAAQTRPAVWSFLSVHSP